MTTGSPPPTPPEREPGPTPPDQAGDVDLSLIRWALTLEPIERLRYVERMNASIAALRALNAEEDEDSP